MLLNAAFVEWTTVGGWTRVHHLCALGERRLFHVMHERDTLCGQNVTRLDRYHVTKIPLRSTLPGSCNAATGVVQQTLKRHTRLLEHSRSRRMV